MNHRTCGKSEYDDFDNDDGLEDAAQFVDAHNYLCLANRPESFGLSVSFQLELSLKCRPLQLFIQLPACLGDLLLRSVHSSDFARSDDPILIQGSLHGT